MRHDTWEVWLALTCVSLIGAYALSVWSHWIVRRHRRNTRAWMRRLRRMEQGRQAMRETQ